jgi:CHRD domain
MPETARIPLALLGAGAALALGLAVAALASSNGPVPLAGTTSETTEQPKKTAYRATLGVKAEVPAPTGVRANARGTFAVTLTEKGSSYSIKWSLTFRNLSGQAAAAHIHRGKPGKAGPVVVGLCTPCRSGRTGTKQLSKTVVTSLKAGSTYVNVHTARNPVGEIRGQIRKVAKG